MSMSAAVLLGPGEIALQTRPKPEIGPTGALVRVAYAGICGSDIWAYRGVARRPSGQAIGHEFVGIVDSVGDLVEGLAPGDEVVSPFYSHCGKCRFCSSGLSTSCDNISFFGRTPNASGAQSEFVSVLYADSTLVKLPVGTLSDERVAISCLLAGDVVATAMHALSMAQRAVTRTATVIGDGPIGLAAADLFQSAGIETRVLGHHRARAGRLVPGVQWRHVDGADPVDRTDVSVDCVGTRESMIAAVAATDDGGAVGVVGVPHGVREAPVSDMFRRNVGIRFGIAPAASYLSEILTDVLSGRDWSYLVDAKFTLPEVASAYEAMSSRACLKPIVQVDSIHSGLR